MKNVLFEIGCEELPATNLADIFENAEGGVNALELKLKKSFEDKRIAFASARVWATPRRIAFYLEGVAPQQSAKDVMTKLLTKDESYGPDGNATEKILTILKHRQSSLAEIVIQDLNGKPYVFLKKAEPVKKTAETLPEIFEALVRGIGFPKNMRWDDSGLVFPRPIRNYLCLYGDKALSFKIAGVPVGAETSFFQKAARRRVKVAGIDAYFKLLKKEGVILDPVERKAAIKGELDKLTQSLGARLYDDPFLLNEVNFLVEAPDGLSAPFGEEFLKLPLEVLTVSMARKQRIFGVLGKDGKVQPRFLAILDGKTGAKQKALISSNIENILHAKLQDSLFFYKEDSKVLLSKKREELANLIFLKGAGSMLEKSDRLVALSKKLSETPDLDRVSLERAAYLCKADLLTQMVGEFPELQGIIGKYYALENGESRPVAEAIGEQYLPRTVSDKLPETVHGGLLSILDKTDLIVACFGLGLEPSSSLDPYGLRRSAGAILKIILENNLPLSLGALLNETKKALGAYVQKDKEEALLKKLDAFFKDRFKAVLADRGYREDLVDAAMATGFDRPLETFKRVHEISRFMGEESFTQSQKVLERTVNILKGNKEPLDGTIDPALLVEDVEKRLYEAYNRSKAGILAALDAGDFRRATSLYAEAFFAILSEFFEKVFVNAEDLKVRKNRLTLLKAIKDLYAARIADLSRIRQA